MEPLTMVSTFATIVSLLSIWKSERADSDPSQQTVDQYVEWLRRHEFAQLADALCENEAALSSISDLLTSNHEEVLEKLAVIENVVIDVAGQIGELRPLANAFGVASRISDQAVSLLRQMNDGETSSLLEVNSSSGRQLLRLDGKGQSLNVSEPRFLNDDLETLCEFRLMRPDYNSKGDRIFRITREGAVVGGHG